MNTSTRTTKRTWELRERERESWEMNMTTWLIESRMTWSKKEQRWLWGILPGCRQSAHSYLAHPPPSVPHCTVLILLLTFFQFNFFFDSKIIFISAFIYFTLLRVHHTFTHSHLLFPILFLLSLSISSSCKWDLFRNFSEQSIVHYYNEMHFGLH